MHNAISMEKPRQLPPETNLQKGDWLVLLTVFGGTGRTPARLFLTSLCSQDGWALHLCQGLKHTLRLAGQNDFTFARCERLCISPSIYLFWDIG